MLLGPGLNTKALKTAGLAWGLVLSLGVSDSDPTEAPETTVEALPCCKMTQGGLLPWILESYQVPPFKVWPPVLLGMN